MMGAFFLELNHYAGWLDVQTEHRVLGLGSCFAHAGGRHPEGVPVRSDEPLIMWVVIGKR